MCTVSMIGDGWRDQFPDRYPWVNPQPQITPLVPTQPLGPINIELNPPTRAEFEKLKKEIEELKELLKAAQKFDEATGQPHCEQDEKIKFLRQIADFVGVNLEEVFGK